MQQPASSIISGRSCCPVAGSVLFTITAVTGGLDAAQVAVLDVTTGVRTIVVRGGTNARYVPTGHLVYVAAGTLRAVAFDLRRLETTGTPGTVLDRVVTSARGAGDFVIGEDGSLAYAQGPDGTAPTTLAWVDRLGHEEPVPAPPRAYYQPRVSPDGANIAVTVAS